MKHYEEPTIEVINFEAEDIMNGSLTETETDTPIQNGGEWN